MEAVVLTVREAAAVLRISPSMMYKLLRENQVPHIEVGNRKIIPNQKFIEWINTEVKGG